MVMMTVVRPIPRRPPKTRCRDPVFIPYALRPAHPKLAGSPIGRTEVKNLAKPSASKQERGEFKAVKGGYRGQRGA